MYIQRTNTIDINIITKHLYNFFVKYFDFVSVQSNYIVNTFIMVPPGGSYFTQMDLQYHIPNINKHSQESVQIFCGHVNYRPVLSVTCDMSATLKSCKLQTRPLSLVISVSNIVVM